MVFSFFKKDAKDSKAGVRGQASGPPRADQRPLGRPLAGPVNRSLNRTTDGPTSGGGFAVTETAVPDRERARSIAMATAAKIDAIESEMTRDFLKPQVRRPAAAEGEDPAREIISIEAAPALPDAIEMPAVAPPVASAPAAAQAALSEDDAFDPGSEILGGSIDAIEVNAGNAGILDETAILFSNRQDEVAESGLRAALVAEALGPLAERGWFMLLELAQQRGDRVAFDQIATQFLPRFGTPAPAWVDYDAGSAKRAAGVPGVPMVEMPAAVDAGIVKLLEEFKSLAANHPSLVLDFTEVRQIDLVGAELLLRVFNAFKRASHELSVRGAERLLAALRAAVMHGRRDPSDSAWMLLLEVQRLLNCQEDFEETGIQYCITYEVSPPSWEPPPPNIRLAAEEARPASAAPSGAAAPGNIEWKGEILGDGEQFLGRLVLAAREARRLSVNCVHLRRVTFSSATSLLSQLVKLQQMGISVEFHDVNCLVGALWQLVGASAVADVHVRRS